MNDWLADWKKWTPVERVFAVLIAVLMVALPLGFVLAATTGV